MAFFRKTPDDAEGEVKRFYERWRSSVYTFSLFFLGDHDKAELAAGEAFFRFLRESPDLQFDQLPIGLMRRTLETSKEQQSLLQYRMPETEELVDTLPLLGDEERAVFILHNILEMPTAEVAITAGMTSDQVQRLYSEALVHLREVWMKKPTT